MPVYEYKCKSCDRIIEKFTTNYNETQIQCECESQSQCERIISQQGRSVFSGNGFYETDYKAK